MLIMLRVIIAGSRSFGSFTILERECHRIFKSLSEEGYLSGNVKEDCSNMEIISGTANGADRFGEAFAKKYRIEVKRFPAQWHKYGKGAGYVRNKIMAQYAAKSDQLGVLIAFWDGKSRGTKMMIDLAKKNNLKVFVINVESE